MRQMLIEYSHCQELNSNLGRLEWPSAVLDMQRAWIGQSEGVVVNFPLKVHLHSTLF